MADSYSVKAILSAEDRNFSSTMKSAQNSLKGIAGSVRSGLGFGILAGVGQQAFNAITGSAKNLIGEINQSNASWKVFSSNMSMIGKGEQEIACIKKELQSFAQETIYSASDMATTFSQLEAVGTKNTVSLVKGFGGLAAAAENPKQAMKTLSMQATQMAAKPTVAWQDFKLMLEQTPAGMAHVAKAMGMTTGELVKSVQDGTVATEDFFNAISKVGTNQGFTDLATQYKTAGQAMDGLTETLSNKLSPAFDVVSNKGIGSISGIIAKVEQLDGDLIAKKLAAGIDKITPYWTAFSTEVKGVGKAFGSAVSSIYKEFTKLTGAFGSTESVKSFSDVIGVAGNALKKFAGFCEEHAGVIAKLITQLPKLLIAYKGFKIVNSLAPGVTAFGKGILSLAGKGIGGIAGHLFGIGKGQEEVGKKSKASSKQLLTSAKSMAIMGVAVLTVAVGFGILSGASIALSNSGGLAIGVMAGMVAALAALGLGMAMLLKFLAPMSKKLMPAATAMLALGAAVALVAAAFAVMAFASISLANAGGLAIGVMAGLVIALAGLMALAVVLAPALAVGTVGFMAFGAMILMCGAGALLAAAALYVVASVLPIVSQYGLQGAIAIAQLSLGLIAFGAGALVAGAGAVVLGAGLAVVAVGLLAVGAAVIVAAAGVLALAAGAVVLGTGLILAGTAVTMMSVSLPMAAAGALALMVAFTALLAVSIAFGAASLVASAGMIALVASALGATVGIAAFGVAMTVSSAGVLAMGVSLKLVQSSMKSIASSAKTTQSSLKSMTSSVKFVSSGLDALGNKAKSAMNKLTSAFSSAESKAKTSGREVGNGFTSGMQSGLSKAPAVALSVNVAVSSSLRAGRSGAYAAGAYVSQGFALGMRSQLGSIRSAAAQMAAAADAAVRAKAKIHSPSRVAGKLGGYWGSGLAGGMLDKVKEVWKAAQELINIPQVATPELNLAYVGELSEDYEYYRNAQYTIVVPVEIEGREVAKVTAPYTEAELDKRQRRDSRKHGKY